MTEPLTIHVLHSAHTDIGYTHPQEQIGWMYLSAYERVLDLCRATQDAPDASRFKWTCETFWQLQHFLKYRPERLEEVLHFVRRGQIEITGAYLHFTDLIDADALARSLDLAADFCRTHDLPLTSAMHCDINGWPWALADLLPERGIENFLSQIHLDSATDPLGQRGSGHYQWLREWGGGGVLDPDMPVRVPQAFWWEGPNGGRSLHWLGEHYNLGNVLGISSPQGFGADKTRYFLETDRLTDDDLYQRAQTEVPKYVERLRQSGYTLDVLLISTAGFYVDNSPPDDRWCRVIARWNAEQGGNVRLRTSTLSEWFSALRQRDPGDWPVRRVAWPDHWAHGLGSATAQVAQARRSQRRRTDVAALVHSSSSDGARWHLEQALEEERLALEHTFDAWSTTQRPGARDNAFQWAAKELAFHRTELHLDEAAGQALRARHPAGSETRLYTPDEPENAGRLLHFDAGDAHPDPEHQELWNGTVSRPFQRDHPTLSHFVAAPGDGQLGPWTLRARTATANAASTALTLTNAAWTLTLDPATGGLTSLRGPDEHDWVDPERRWAFGVPVHESVVHPLGREAVGNTARFVQLGVAGPVFRERLTPGPVVRRSVLAVQGVPGLIRGPVFDALSVRGTLGAAGEVTLEWRAYHQAPVVELVVDWEKSWSDRPEAAYVPFPFTARSLALETGGGFFQPGHHGSGGQLPGTSSAYYTVQRAAALRAGEHALAWLPLDAPLVMTNALDFARWETGAYDFNGLLASMPVNHYWHTNFPTSQRGPLRLRYRFAPLGDDTERAVRMATPLEALGWR